VLTFSLVLAVIAAGCTNRLFLYPTHDPVEVGPDAVYELVAETRPIAGRRMQLFRGYVGPDDHEHDPAVTVLAFGGNGGRAEYTLTDLRRFFAAARCDLPCDSHGGPCGVEILAAQYPGFGADEERATLRGLAAGTLEAWAWTRARSPERPIVVYGLSMGSTAALHIARTQADADEPGPAALILDRPPHIPGLVLGRFGWWNLWVLAGPVAASLPRAVHSRANGRRLEGTPALFMLASDDHLATPRNAGKVVSAYAGPKLTAHFPGHHNSRLDAAHPTVAAGLGWLWGRLGFGLGGCARASP
jgi:hypothetical protein